MAHIPAETFFRDVTHDIFTEAIQDIGPSQYPERLLASSDLTDATSALGFIAHNFAEVDDNLVDPNRPSHAFHRGAIVGARVSQLGMGEQFKLYVPSIQRAFIDKIATGTDADDRIHEVRRSLVVFSDYALKSHEPNLEVINVLEDGMCPDVIAQGHLRRGFGFALAAGLLTRLSALRNGIC